MTTPLKALIQERLRAKIVRQEVDGDEMDELTTMDHEQHQQQQHHHRHRNRHEHRHRDVNELQSPSQLQRNSGQAQRNMRQQQSTQETPQQCHKREPGHHPTRYKSSSIHNQQQRQQEHHEEIQEPHQNTSQKLIDYYTWEHHQKYDNYFPQDRSFVHGFHDERYKTLGYDADRSPLPSPWRGSSGARNQFQEEEDQERQVEGEESMPIESPKYAPSQHHQQRAASVELRQRNRDAQVHPVNISSRKLEASDSAFASAKRVIKPQQKTEQLQPHDAYESVYSVIAKSSTQGQEHRQHSYPRGYFESQLYDDDVPDTKLDEDHREHLSKRQQPHQHDQNEPRHRHKHHSTGSVGLENPCEAVPRKRSFGTFDAPYDVEDASYEPHGRARTYHRTQHHEGAVRDSHTDDSKPSYHYQQQRRHHSYNHEQPRFEHGALHVDDMVTSPLAAASSLAPLVFAAVTSPRLETKRSFRDESRQRVQSLISAASISAPVPAPLDMVVIETTRRRDDLDTVPVLGNNIRRRSSSTLVRRLDAMLSPGCHRAATAFVEKRRRRAANSTPRTMATQRWLQSMDPQFRESKSSSVTRDHYYEPQHIEVALPPLSPSTTALYSARSASSCSISGSSSSSCTSPM